MEFLKIWVKKEVALPKTGTVLLRDCRHENQRQEQDHCYVLNEQRVRHIRFHRHQNDHVHQRRGKDQRHRLRLKRQVLGNRRRRKVHRYLQAWKPRQHHHSLIITWRTSWNHFFPRLPRRVTADFGAQKWSYLYLEPHASHAHQKNIKHVAHHLSLDLQQGVWVFIIWRRQDPHYQLGRGQVSQSVQVQRTLSPVRRQIFFKPHQSQLNTFDVRSMQRRQHHKVEPEWLEKSQQKIPQSSANDRTAKESEQVRPENSQRRGYDDGRSVRIKGNKSEELAWTHRRSDSNW